MCRDGAPRGLSLDYRESKAGAEGVSRDQAAFFLGSDRGSRRIDWSVSTPARQRVPSRRLSALEHEWKDGSSWLPAEGIAAEQNVETCAGETGDGSRVSATCPVGLTAIMEGRIRAILAPEFR